MLSTSSGTFGIPQIVNQAYLRLTDNTGNNSAAATVPGIFPAAGNYISVEFRQFAYNGSGADGIAVTLSDYSVAPTPGAFGGSLGYAQKTGINGFAGGWVGVALDEFGNFENNTEGRSGGTPPCAGQCPNSVGIRGSGSGNAARGKTVFEGKGGCAQCHRVATAGSRVGPDLSDIGALRRTVEIERSLLEPDEEVLPQNRYYRVVTKQGETITGRILNLDTFTVQMLDSKERMLSLQRSDLREAGFVDKSPMPSYRDKLSSQELADIVTYLASLKGL